MKLPKENLIFIEDPKVKKFIKYCKEKYSDKIEKIELFLNTDHDDWQMNVAETTPGIIWVPWRIPTQYPGAVEENKTIKSRYGHVPTYPGEGEEEKDK